MNSVATALDASWPTADKPIGRFEEQGILHEMTGQRRSRAFRYGPCLALFQDVESPEAARDA